MRSAAAVWGGGIAVVVSCSPPVDPSARPEELQQGIVVTTARSTYAATGEIVLTIRNRTGEDVRISLCPGTLEHQQGDRWVRSEQLMLCANEATLLGAGTSRTEVTRLPEGVEPGEHRVVVHLFGADDPVSYPAPGDAVSNTFVVTD